MPSNTSRRADSSELGPTIPLIENDDTSEPTDQSSGPKIGVQRGCPLEKSRAEAASLLQSRLRALALVGALGSGLFLCVNAILWRVSVIQVIELTFALAILAFLTRRTGMCMRSLRLTEAGFFGGFTVLFALESIFSLPFLGPTATPSMICGALSEMYFMWALLALTYSLFIPHRCRHSATVALLLATMPNLLTVGLCLYSTQVALAVTTSQLLVSGTMAYFAVFIGIFATHTMNQLRTEARRAKRFGQYQLREKLGEGGMGEVYRAEHAMLKRPCAIKLIRSDVLADQSVRDRFEREVQSTAMLTHPNTVEVFDHGRTDDGTFYYVMELLPGMTLQDLVEKHGPMSAPRVVHLLRQVCGALAEAHSEGLIHRDVKPANIFSSHRGGVWDTAKLLDFGLVKGQPNKAPDSLAATREGTVAGSPLYMAPEQAKGTEPDPRSDLYSLGGVGYFLLTGQAPFDGETPMEVIIAHARDQVVPISEINPDVPEDLEAVVMRCLEKRPDDRYASAEDLELALAEVRCEEWTRRMAREWWDNAPSEREEEPELARA